MVGTDIEDEQAAIVSWRDGLAEVVVVFPTNVWEYDVLDHFPFKDVDIEKVKQGGVPQSAK